MTDERPQKGAEATGIRHIDNPLPLNPAGYQTRARRQRVLRVRITDVVTGRLKVGLSLPAGLVAVALRQGARLIPPGHDDLDLVAAIDQGDLQAPVVIEDEQNGERVEISLE